MKQLSIDTSSLHWRLASVYGPMSERDVRMHGTDICEYTRAVLAGIVKWFLCIGLGAFVGLCLGDALAWIAAGIVTNFVDPGMPATVAVLVISGVTAVFLWLLVTDWIKEWLYRRAKRRLEKEADEQDDEEREPSFIVEAYRAFKDKYCVRMKIDD